MVYNEKRVSNGLNFTKSIKYIKKNIIKIILLMHIIKIIIKIKIEKNQANIEYYKLACKIRTTINIY